VSGAKSYLRVLLSQDQQINAAAIATVVRATTQENGTIFGVGLLDSCLQLGQVFLLQESVTKVYIPSGFDAMKSSDRSKQGDSLFTSVLPKKRGDEGEMKSDYWLASTTAQLPLNRSGSGSSSLSLLGMKAKPMPTKASLNRDLLYESHLLVEDQSFQSLSDQAEGFVIKASSVSSELAMSISLIVHAPHGRELVVTSGGPSRLAHELVRLSGADSAAMTGLLKTARLEQPLLRVTHLSTTKHNNKTVAKLRPCVPQDPSQFRLLPSKHQRKGLDCLVQSPLTKAELGFLDHGQTLPKEMCLVEVKAVGINFRDVLNVSA
jgi:hypothetical protein